MEFNEACFITSAVSFVVGSILGASIWTSVCEYSVKRAQCALEEIKQKNLLEINKIRLLQIMAEKNQLDQYDVLALLENRKRNKCQ